MRHLLTIVTTAALCGLVAPFGMTEDQSANRPLYQADEGRTAMVADARLRAEIHRTLAALIEARSAEKPDLAKIDELNQKLRQLRTKLQAHSGVVAARAPEGWVCPRGGPGMGFGFGRGWGWARGGKGPGAGFGPGAGLGWGGGRGLGPGAGQGRAPGVPAFVDQDKDGICDYYELRHGMHQ